ncbi:hypothetical protein DMH27_01280 [Raoultella planticola]|nr:hypothetical protein [Raoultella planticola]
MTIVTGFSLSFLINPSFTHVFTLLHINFVVNDIDNNNHYVQNPLLSFLLISICNNRCARIEH